MFQFDFPIFQQLLKMMDDQAAEEEKNRCTSLCENWKEMRIYYFFLLLFLMLTMWEVK